MSGNFLNVARNVSEGPSSFVGFIGVFTELSTSGGVGVCYSEGRLIQTY